MSIFKRKSSEYRILQANSLISEEQLNDLAKDGWKLVTIVLVDYIYYFYFVKEN